MVKSKLQVVKLLSTVFCQILYLDACITLLAVVDIMHIVVVNVPMETTELGLGILGAMESVAG